MSKKVPMLPDQHGERILGENGRLILTLKDRRGQPITAKTKVFVKEEAPSGSHEYRAEGQAGQVTRFIFDIPPHIYTVQVWAEGYEVYSQFVTVRTDQKSIFEFKLQSKRDEDEKEEGEAELVRGRFESFIKERVHPGKDFPSDARLKALMQKKRMNDPDVTNSSLKVKAVANPLPGSSFGNIDAYVKVEPKSVRDGFHRSLLKIAYDKKKLGWVDEASLRVFEVDGEKRQFHLIRDSGVDAARGYAFAYIEKPGVYGVIGLSEHPAVVEAVRLFSQFKGQLLDEKQRGVKTVQNHICNLILCADDFNRSPFFAEHGEPIPPGGFSGNVCDFCFGIDIPPGGLPEGELGRLGGTIVVPGCNWFSIGPRNINGRIRAMAIHPNDGNTVYAGSANAGVWVTNDAGESWRPLMHDEPALEIGAVAVHLTDPAIPAGDVTIYAGTGEPTWWAGYAGIGVLKSTDSGANWWLTGAIANERFSAVLIAPHSVTNDPATSVVYAGGTPGGLYKSINGGAAWTLVLPKNITGLAMDPGDLTDNTIYAAVAGEGIYKNTNGGVGIWDLSRAGATTDQLILVEIGKSAPYEMYAKFNETVYVFDRVMMTWRWLGDHGGDTYDVWNNVLGVDPQDSNIIYAGGIFLERSFDGGEMWHVVPITVLHDDQHALVFDSTNHLNVYVGNDGGVYRGVYTSPSSIGSWSKASNGLILTQFNHVGVSEAGPNVVGGGSFDNGNNRTVGGLTWDHIGSAIGDGGFFVIDPADPYIIYIESAGGRFFKSTNGGASFASASAGFPGGSLVTPIVLDSTSPLEPNRVLFAGGLSEVYRSTNSAGLWTASSPNLGGEVNAIAIAPASSAIVYAGTGGGAIWRSSDNGATRAGWANITIGTVTGSITLPTRMLKDIGVHPANPDRLFVTFSGFDTFTPLTPGHVFRGTSTDGGATWRWDNISSNLPDTPVNAIAVDHATPSTLYVGTDIGVFRTTDGGLSWVDFDAGLPNVVIADLAINAAGDKLCAATYGYGMFQLHLGGACPDVDIYVRDNKLDTGEAVLSPSGVLDPSAVGANVYWWESADIKVDAFPYLPPDVLFDGVEFDTLAGEEVERNDATHPNPNHLYVQVHNRGPLTAHNVKVKVLWADASAGLPALPADFWTNYPNDWTAASIWQTVNPAVPFRNILQLLPHTPKVLMWNWTVPTTAAEHTCMLAVISSDEDAVTRTDADPNDHLVWMVVPNDKHITLRNLHVITAAAPPPGGGPRPMASTIDFHNPFPFPQHFDIELDQPAVSRELHLSLLLPKVQTQVPLTQSLGTGIEVGAITGKEDWWAKLEGIHQRLLQHHCVFDHDKLEHGCDRKQPHIPKVLIPAGERLRATLIITPPDAKPGSTFRFTIRQVQGSTLIGGSTYEVRIPLPDRTIIN